MTTFIATGYSPHDALLPHIAYQSHDATVTASGTVAGTSADWVTNGEDGSRWHGSDTSAVYVSFDYDAAEVVNYVGLAAVDVADSDGLSVQVQLTDGGAWVSLFDLTAAEAADSDTMLFLFPSVAVWGVRVSVSVGDALADCYLGVMKAGQSMVFPRGATYIGTPISEGRQVTYTTQRSLKGAVLSRTVQGSHLMGEISVANLSEDWRRGDDWQDFIVHVEEDLTGSFFVVPKPEKYPEDMAFGVATERPIFDRTTPNRRVAGSVTIQFTGYRSA